MKRMKKPKLRPFMLHEEVVRAFPEKFKTKVVYHYTTTPVLEILLNSKDAQLYCTNAKALNDDQEYKLGIEYAESHIAEVMNLNAEVYAEVKDMLKIVRDNDFRIPWVMSFSSARDLLSQWRAYTDKKNGGFAIGFSLARVEELVKRIVTAKNKKKKSMYILHFLPCFYLNYESPDDMLEVSKFFQLIFKYYYTKIVSELVDTTNPHAYAASIVSFICVFAAFIKHAAFREEQEYRLMLQVTDKKYERNVEIIGGKPRLRIAKDIKGEDVRKLISELWISPHGDIEMLKSLAHYLNIKQKSKIDLYTSNLPYNGK